MTGFDLSTASDIRIGSTQVSAVYLGANKIWPVQHDYSQDYLTIVSLEDNNEIQFVHPGSEPCTILVSTDNGTTWVSKTASYPYTSLATLNTGDKLLLKGSNTSYCSSNDPNTFRSSKKINVEGNIMSLIYGDNFINKTTLPPDIQSFDSLFSRCTKLISAENLILPATTLTYMCYGNMFYSCTSLTTAPEELPATTLAMQCYYGMFKNCTSLTTAPELPAMMCDYQSCYEAMFQDCTSLTTAPELPATTLGISCYQFMFNGCTSLTTAPELPVTTLAMACYSAMFEDCTSLTTAPELPAITLVNSCYYNMFNGCLSLNYIKCLATDISANYCTTNWVNNVAATGTFVKDPNMTSWTTGTSGIPSGWTIQNA